VEANAQMSGSELTAAFRKKRLDSVAACIILERYFREATA
jgi:RNase H-fold protein (predicted Holliday junction resolvase)